MSMRIEIGSRQFNLTHAVILQAFILSGTFLMANHTNDSLGHFTWNMDTLFGSDTIAQSVMWLCYDYGMLSSSYVIFFVLIKGCCHQAMIITCPSQNLQFWPCNGARNKVSIVIQNDGSDSGKLPFHMWGTHQTMWMFAGWQHIWNQFWYAYTRRNTCFDRCRGAWSNKAWHALTSGYFYPVLWFRQTETLWFVIWQNYAILINNVRRYYQST